MSCWCLVSGCFALQVRHYYHRTLAQTQNTLSHNCFRKWAHLLQRAPDIYTTKQKWVTAHRSEQHSDGKHTEETDSSLSSCLSAGDAVKRCLFSLGSVFFVSLSISYSQNHSVPSEPVLCQSSTSPSSYLVTRLISVYPRPILSLLSASVLF